MTAPNVKQEFEAVRVDSIYGGNKTAFLLRKAGNPIVDARIEVPFGSGNARQDRALWKEIQSDIERYTRTGQLPRPEFIAQ